MCTLKVEGVVEAATGDEEAAAGRKPAILHQWLYCENSASRSTQETVVVLSTSFTTKQRCETQFQLLVREASV